MERFYLAAFVVGFALTLISFLTGVAGHSLGHLGTGHAADLGPGAHGTGGHGDAQAGSGVPLVNFGTLTAFLTWFGGFGFLLTAYSRVLAFTTVVLALAGGLLGAALVFLFMARILTADYAPLDPADYYLPGTLGRVTVTLPPTGTGEMVYTQAGTRKTVAARSAERQEVAKGTEVIVLRYERGIAYVRPWDQISAPPPGSPASGV
jgi:membrane protein implicated in regulation of membrane protease activity